MSILRWKPNIGPVLWDDGDTSAGLWDHGGQTTVGLANDQVHSCWLYVHFGKESKNSDYSENEKQPLSW